MNIKQEQLCKKLNKVLDTYISIHKELLSVLIEKKEAMRRADSEHIKKCLTKEHELAAGVERLNTERQTLILELARECNIAGDKNNITITRIAEQLPETSRKILLVKAESLKGIIKSIKKESTIIRTSGEMLSAHLAGLMHKINALASATGLYGCNGRVGATPSMITTLDVSQ